jgi:hypothetical protein
LTKTAIIPRKKKRTGGLRILKSMRLPFMRVSQLLRIIKLSSRYFTGIKKMVRKR